MSEARADRVVPFEFRTFAGISAFFVVLGTIYVFTSFEPAGTTMLFSCAGLGALGMWVSGATALATSRSTPRRLPNPATRWSRRCGR